MRIDLHTHSNRSDGTDSPSELIRNAAREAHLDVVALTDHDATAGWDEAQVAADEEGIRFIRGIEISTTLNGSSVHLLGYEFDAEDPDLVAELERVRGGRDDRLPRMLERLALEGIHLTIDEVAQHSEHAAATGRPHVADAMVAKGYVADRDEAFRDWLAHGRPGHVARYSCDLFRAVELIGAAGGKSVVAHGWARESRDVLTVEVFEQLTALGLAGIEVDHNDHTPGDRQALAHLADALGLAKTGSSDYHGTGKDNRFHLGANLTDPAELERLLG